MDLLLDCVRAFLVGGAWCVLAQLLIDLTKITPARILVCYVILGVGLGAVGWFEPMADFGGCGMRVPLVGFGATIAKGVREAVHTQGLLGALSGGLAAASAGVTAALCFGYLAALVTRSKPKRLQ